MYSYITAETFNHALHQVTHKIWFLNYLLYNIIFLDNFPILQYHICRPDESWLLAKLLYHTLEVNNCFNLSLKIWFITAKVYSYLQHLCQMHGLFWETTPHANVTASLWDMPLKTHISTNQYLAHFLLITVSFLTYLIIFAPDKMLLIFQLSLKCLFHIYDWS